MPYNPSSIDILCTTQTLRQYYIRIELLNTSMQVVDTLQYELISGDYKEDADSDIRRICSLTFVVKNATYFANQFSKIWLDKYVRISLGLDYVARQETLWYPLGIYLFNDTSFIYDMTSRTVTVSCLDMMSLFTGVRNGAIPSIQTIIPAGSSIKNVITTMLKQYYNITNVMIEETETVPYDIELAAGATFYDMLSEMKELYPAREMYFDEYGVFTWKQIPTTSTETSLFDDSILGDLIISQSTTRSFSEIKNAVRVYGKDDMVWTTKLYAIKPTTTEERTTYIVDVDNPYTIDKVGEVWSVLSGGHYEKIYTDQLLQERAGYELWLGTNWGETLSLEGMLIPFIHVNTKFTYQDKMTREVNDYIIKSISYDFASGTMDMSCMRYFPLYSFV